MFALLVNNVFLNFWVNSPGDEFIAATIKGLSLPASQVRLIHYPGLVKPAFFAIQEDNSLVVKEQIITPAAIEGDPDVISYNDVAVIPGVLYYENGNMIQPC